MKDKQVSQGICQTDPGRTANMTAETLEDRYAIYVQCMRDLGEPIKSFDEWLNS